MTKLLLALVLSFALVSCGASNPTTVVTPPAPADSPDLKIAKSLYVAGTTIDSLTPIVTAHPEIKDTVNKMRATYTEVKAAYLTFHDAVVAGQTPDPTTLAAKVTQLITDGQALADLYRGK